MSEEKKMTHEEAGQKGGETTSSNHGEKFYQEIGEKGGKSQSSNNK
ncbi:hypothetical protein ACPAY5_06775 [Staphylococcus caledonicus]